jgi:hypothetical protein
MRPARRRPGAHRPSSGRPASTGACVLRFPAGLHVPAACAAAKRSPTTCRCTRFSRPSRSSSPPWCFPWVGTRTGATCRATSLLIACAFLGVALLDFSHMLSFTGMPDFVTPSGPSKGDPLLAGGAHPGRANAAGRRDPPLASAAPPRRSPLLLLLAAVVALVVRLHWLILYHADRICQRRSFRVGAHPI